MYSVCIYGSSADISKFSGVWDTAVNKFANTDLEICGPFKRYILIADRQRTDKISDNRQSHSNGVISCFQSVCFSSRNPISNLPGRNRKIKTSWMGKSLPSCCWEPSFRR